MKTLETPRLILRGFQETDAADMFAYATHPLVGPGAGWQPHGNLQESEQIVRMFIQADNEWALVDKESGKVIGSLGIHRDTRRNHEKAREIGYALSAMHWGKGLALEAVQAVLRYAFEEEKLAIISAFHYPHNTRSKRVIEKAGLRYEGTLRLATQVYTGEIFDNVCYAITREEWLADQRNGL